MLIFAMSSWNSPESFVTLDSPEVDTSVVPDVLGLRACYPDAKPTRVLPGRALNSVRLLVPDARATSWGFHDVTLVDMTRETGPTVSMGKMSNLQRQWPRSLLTGMTRRQTDLHALRRECKRWFRNSQAGSCTYCGSNIFTTWHTMSLIITWTWDSCGGAQCHGVLSGKGLPRTASIIFSRDTMCVSQSKLATWGSGSLRGL